MALGHGQRGDRVLAAAPHVQGDPAGDQHDQLRAGLQQGEHAVPGGQQVLEIVQQDQQLPGPQGGRQPPGQRGRVALVHPQPLGDRAQHQPRVAQRRQVYEHGAVGQVAGYLPGHLDGQPGLAHPARSGEHQQLDVSPAEQLQHRGRHAGPADQWGKRTRQSGPGQRRARPGSAGRACPGSACPGALAPGAAGGRAAASSSARAS